MRISDGSADVCSSDLPAPGLDDKVLADWNGLMIAALAQAAGVFGEPAWLAAAERAFAFVAPHMTGEDGRLRHSWRNGRLRHPATLDAYAQLARADLFLLEETGTGAYLVQSTAWAATAARHYADPAGCYFLTTHTPRP